MQTRAIPSTTSHVFRAVGDFDDSLRPFDALTSDASGPDIA